MTPVRAISVGVGLNSKNSVYIEKVHASWSGCTNQAESLEEREPPGTGPINILYHKFYTTLFIQAF